MRPLIAILVLLILLQQCTAMMRPTKTYERAMNASIDAEEELHVCRAAATKDLYKDIACFEEALEAFPYNASWSKQLGALYVTTAQRAKAMSCFNQSAFTILEANGFVGKKAPNVSASTKLKLYHVREGERGIELGKVWCKAFQLEHRSIEASKILDDFLTWEADFDEAIDLYRDLGSIVDVVKLKRMKYEYRQKTRAKHKQGKAKRMPERQKFLAHLAEEIPRLTHDISSRYLSGHLTATKVGKNETHTFSRDRCGMILQYKDKYTLTSLVTYMGVCVAKWGDYKELSRNDGPPAPYGALMRTPMHSLASFGTEFLVRHVAEMYPPLLEATDNFGWTPMHYAVAYNNKKAINVLLKIGGSGQLAVKDAGEFTPLKIGCMNVRFRSTMQQIAKAALGIENPCGPHEVADHVVDDEDEDDDDDQVPVGGKWKNAKHDPETSRCDFDVRHGASMSHHELVGRYIHASRPVVLRDIVPLKTRKALMKNKLKSQHHDVSVRIEEFPAAEHYGGKLYNVSTLKHWMNKGDEGTFAVVETSKKHPLAKQAWWVPDRLVLDDEGYLATDNAWPQLVAAKEGAVTNHAIRGTHEVFAVVHGVQTWGLYSPDAAMTTRHPWRTNVTDSAMYKCTVHSGDVLVIPQLWATAFRSHGESIGVRRKLVWK